MDDDDELIDDDGSNASSGSEIDAQLGAGWDGGLLSKEDINLFRKRLHNVVLPKYVTKLPTNLGESSAGSLKAAQWHSLFAYAIPLIIPECYVGKPDHLKKESTNGQILSNIGCLCRCTNIVSAKKVSEYEAKQFEISYRNYTESSKSIFKDLSIKPNHHYALHIPTQLRLWGPLCSVAEFAGERLIGVLQKIKTNGRLG